MQCLTSIFFYGSQPGNRVENITFKFICTHILMNDIYPGNHFVQVLKNTIF